jgi:peptidyl-prolyl cis-trans isomerase A (cyclophilin A)
MKNGLLACLSAVALLSFSAGCRKNATPASQTASPSAAAPSAAAPSKVNRAALLSPSQLTEQAPASYRARFKTTRGDFVIEVQRDWAPLGADRFYNLVKAGYYIDTRFFRVIKGFMAQWGIHSDPQISSAWREMRITDDPVKQSNKPGFISFATGGPNTRTTQVFINYADNSNLDQMGFAPFGRVTNGMDVVENLFGDYGEGAPRGRGPFQGRLQGEGEAYLAKEFPSLDRVLDTTLE